jgi:hypothetical protein
MADMLTTDTPETQDDKDKDNENHEDEEPVLEITVNSSPIHASNKKSIKMI